MSPAELLASGASLIALALETVAALVIVAGSVAAISVFLRARDPTRARHAMSHILLLALDFTIGADILKSVAAPADASSVAVLGLVVLVRIALTFALRSEVSGFRGLP
jgi:uncharacterized membrane protein